MDNPGLLALVHNAALLLAAIFLYDLASRYQRININLFGQTAVGLALGLITILIMLTPWVIKPGVSLDTRSVLLGIAGLFFGSLPTIIAILLASAFRVYLGGIAVMTGLAVIVGALGVIWRYFRKGDMANIHWRELFLFGFIQHLLLLLLMFTLPFDKALAVIALISLPILTLYPCATTLIGSLLAKRLVSETLRDSLAQSKEIIWQKTHLDPLTQLPNRHMLVSHLDQAIQEKQPLALLFLDLDSFKEVNDTLGHGVGDHLLQLVSQRLRICLHETDMLARLGGDEFMVVLSGNRNASHIAETMLHGLTEPYHLNGEDIYISGSIGITLFPNDANTVETLLKNSEQAMYFAKNQGRNRYHYFTPAMQEISQQRMRLISDLRTALNEQQFLVHYQPIIELATGKICKAEALVRWQHPQRGLVSPTEFISLAEETGMIIDLGNWVFLQAAKQIAQWRDWHNIDLQVSVNKSPIQFRDNDDNFEAWCAQLKELRLSRHAITIEITEGLLLDANHNVRQALTRYHAAGIQVALDDFGTGYSSLAYLKKFDIDYLKIDQSFIRNLSVDSDDLALCEAIIVMAHKLKIMVIAEGVETEAQRQLLADAGCDFAQGYLFSRPVPADEFAQLFLAH